MTSAPYYDEDGVTLYLGDCLDLISNDLSLNAEPALTAQIVVTSPPYNMGLQPGGNGRGMYRPGAGSNNRGARFREGYDQHDDALPQDEYDAWQRDVLGVLWQLIPDDGAIYYNHRERIEHGVVRLPLGLNFGLPLRQMLTWDRGIGIGVNLRHYCSVAERIYLFAKPDFHLASHSASGGGDVWRLGTVNKAENEHPAPFPVGLPGRAIADTAARSVLDPFCGSGSTLVAARLAGIAGIGIEKSERYCEMTAKRLERLTLLGAAS